jgi:ribonuclease HI
MVFEDGTKRELVGGALEATNNRMELAAAIAALEALPGRMAVEITTDSRYLQRGVTEWLPGWKRRGFARKEGELANADLWRSLDSLLGRHQLSWRWVKGHAGYAMNERADELARRGRDETLAAAGLKVAPERGPAAGALAHEGEAHAFLKVMGSGGGRFVVVVERPGGEASRHEGRAAGATPNRLDLLAALAALAAVPRETPLVLHSGSDYLRNGASEWRHGWRTRGWTTKDGKPVANADLWRQLDSELSGRHTRWPKADAEISRRLAALDRA